MNLDFELYWILVPIVASVIGYSTNWVAIKMLFRPLHEKRIFGLRVPFTPGLIPRRKEEIADNIGQAVAEHLVTSEAIEGRLATLEVKNSLGKTILHWMDRELEKDRGSVREILPSSYEPTINTFQEKFSEKLTEYAVSFLQSDEMEKTLTQLFEGVGKALEGKKVKDILTEKGTSRFVEEIEELIFDFTEESQFNRDVRCFWLKKLREFDHREGEISSLFSDKFQELAVHQARQWVPYLLHKGASLLNNPILHTKIKEFLMEFIEQKLQDRYNQDSVWDQVKYGFVELFVMGNEDLELRVEKAVKEGFPRLLELLEQQEIREELADYGVKTLKKLLDKDISRYQLSNATKRRLATFLTDVSVELSHNEAIRSAIDELLKGLLEDIRNEEINQLLKLGERDSEFPHSVSQLLTQLMKSSSMHRQINYLIQDWVDGISRKRLGKLSRWIEARELKPLVDTTIDQSIGSISREITEVLDIIDVRNLVKKEVNNFSTLRVEGLVLGVTGNQLRAITWFGALLGFVIGVVQLIIVILGG